MAVVFYKSVGSSFVSIYLNGSMHFSAGAVRQFSLLGWKQVLLGYDAELKKVIIRKCKEGEYGSTVTQQGNLMARGFWAYFNLTTELLCGKRHELLKNENEDELSFCID